MSNIEELRKLINLQPTQEAEKPTHYAQLGDSVRYGNGLYAEGDWLELPDGFDMQLHVMAQVSGEWQMLTHEEAEALVIPEYVASYKFKAALEVYNGITEEMVLSIIAQLPSPNDKLARIAFQNAPQIKCIHPSTQEVLGALGLSEEQQNDLFKAAGGLKI